LEETQTTLCPERPLGKKDWEGDSRGGGSHNAESKKGVKIESLNYWQVDAGMERT